MRCNDVLGVALGLALVLAKPALVQSQSSGVSTVAAGDGPGGAASWTTGNKLAVGTSAETDSKVWFTVAKGITSEIFYPRLDVPNMQDMQYIVTDGSTFVDLERDATNHVISMPTEGARVHRHQHGQARNAEVPDHQHLHHRPEPQHPADPHALPVLGWWHLPAIPAREPLHGRRRRQQQCLVGRTNSALMASGTRTLFGSPMTVVSALKVASPNGFVAHDNGYAAVASDCYVDLHKDMASTTSSTAPAMAMLSSAARSALSARTRRSPSRSAMEATRHRPLPRPTDPLRRASPIGRPPTAEAGTAMSTGSAQRPPACRATRCVAAPITLPRWRCTPPRTRHSAAPASQGSQRRGAISRMGTT